MNVKIKMFICLASGHSNLINGTSPSWASSTTVGVPESCKERGFPREYF